MWPNFLEGVLNGFFLNTPQKKSKTRAFWKITSFFEKKSVEIATFGNFRQEGYSKGNIAYEIPKR